ncbi:MAG: hypothetical protein EPN17_12960 [Methylobacter sp.]|nr:MAG: hypothetical protein EPN17_12960 [Methylobacter sp.]
MSVFPVDALRQAFLTLPKQPRQSDSEPIELRYFYAPLSHAKALHPDNMLVEGVYGAGKSEWCLQLSKLERLGLIATFLPRSELENADCSIGFSQMLSTNYPSKESIVKLLNNNIDAQTIWNTIIALAVLEQTGHPNNWNDKINYYEKYIDDINNSLQCKDDELYALNKKHIVLFDALNYAADDNKTIKKLLKGLLQAALKFRSFRAIRLKIFIRPDMLEDSSVYSFAGGSKVINNKFSLEWNNLELFNLLWQYLGNSAEGGKEFRDGCEQHFNQSWNKHPNSNIWQIPDEMRRNEALQREIFHELTGEWMGDTPKSGYPYLWLPNHLEDSHGKVSPCSFLAALHEAAATDDLIEEQQYPLNYQALRKGVQKASQMQVRIFNENYRWIEILLKEKDISFPCEFSELESFETRSKIEEIINEPGTIPPPSYSAQGFEGIKQDLVDLGIFQLMHDGRINMPDVYRLGYGLGRKGGVKPVR